MLIVEVHKYVVKYEHWRVSSKEITQNEYNTTIFVKIL